MSTEHPAEDPVAAQADAVLAVLERALPSDVVLGVSVYGSAVAGGLRPHSDLDLFGVLARRLTDDEKRALIDGLVPISWRQARPADWRPLELTLVVQQEIRPWRYPPRFDFQYGEWLRDDLVSGNLAPWPAANPDLAVQVTMVRATGRALLGPPASDLLDAVPQADVVRAIVDELPPLLADLGSDTRNVLLALARMWTTVATGEVRPKDAAAEWALAHLPAAHRPVLEVARAAYLGLAEDAWTDDMDRVRAHAAHVVREIQRAVAALPPTDASV